MAIADGIYKIVSKLKLTQCVDVWNASTEVHANVQLYEDNDDSNAQKVWVGTDSDGCRDFRFLCSGMMLDVWAGKAELGSNLTQYPYNRDSRAQEWAIVAAGETVKINGVSYDLYYIKTKVNQNYVMDAENGQNRNGTNLQLCPLNKTDAQKWAFVKTSFVNIKLPVPANVGATRTESGNSSYQFGVNATAVEVWPSWQCASMGGWQLRWAWRGRKKGTGTWGAWSDWQALGNWLAGSKADEGWGDAWSCENSHHRSDSGYYSPAFLADRIPLSIDNKTYDKKEYRIEVRQAGTTDALSWNADGVPQHGPSATGIIRAVWWPTLTVNTLTWSPGGLMIGYSTDFERGDNKLAVGRVKVGGRYLTKREIAFSGRARAGTVVIPFSELAFVPEESAIASFSIRLTTIDCTRTQSFTREVTYDANHGIVPAITQGSASGGAVSIKLNASYASSECHIVYEQDGETVISECDAVADGFRAAPPFGRKYSVFVKVSDSENKWGTREFDGRAPAPASCIFNFDGADYFELPLTDEGGGGGPAKSIERDAETYLLAGMRRESTYFGVGSRGSLRVEGIVPMSDPSLGEHCCLGAFRRLAAAGYATYRTPDGDRYDVAVVGWGETPYAPRMRRVELELREQSS